MPRAAIRLHVARSPRRESRTPPPHPRREILRRACPRSTLLNSSSLSHRRSRTRAPAARSAGPFCRSRRWRSIQVIEHLRIEFAEELLVQQPAPPSSGRSPATTSPRFNCDAPCEIMRTFMLAQRVENARARCPACTECSLPPGTRWPDSRSTETSANSLELVADRFQLPACCRSSARR